MLLLFCAAPLQSAEENKENKKAIPVNAAAKDQSTHPAPTISIRATGGTQTIDNACHAAKCNKEPEHWFDKLWSDPVATFTGALFLATLGLIGTGIVQWKALSDTVRAMGDDFASTHRPKMRIKHVYITSEIWGGKPIEIKLVIVNIGITAAVIRVMNLKTIILTAGTQLPPRPTFSDPDKTISLDKVESGITLALPKMTRRDLTAEEHPRLMDGTKKLYCYGFVEYADSRERIRKTAFCRVWVPPTGAGAFSEAGKFVEHPDSDYEYQD